MTGLSRTLLMPLVGALVLSACGTPPQSADSDEAKAEAGAKAEAPIATASSCETLATKICEEAGEATPTCASVKTTTGLLSADACAAGLADIDYTIQQLAKAGEVCATLADRLCKDIGDDTETCKMVRDQTPKMGTEKCQGMMDQYDLVIADLRKMEARNKPLSAEAAAKIAQGDVPDYGPEDAAVTVVEFSDFQCPYCSKAADAINEVKERYGDRVRFVFRQFPLSMHKEAHLAAQAALAAHAQGKFWEYHDLLFANQRKLGRAELEAYAEQIGLDMAAFKKALDEGTYKDTVDAELALGQEVFVSGTPTAFVNGVRVGNATTAEGIASAIDKALAG